jgi:heterodisulfide reductase subunit A-like polyferredoxin
MQGEGVNTIVIAACSGRVKFDVFDFGASNILERVNVREQVVWSHDWTKQVQVKTKDAEGKEEVKVETQPNDDTQRLGEDYLRMGIVKANKTNLPEPYVEEFVKNILVIGGGITGLTAALEAANTGYDDDSRKGRAAWRICGKTAQADSDKGPVQRSGTNGYPGKDQGDYQSSTYNGKDRRGDC